MPHTESPDLSRKWRTLFLLSIAELLGMSVWFAASAVVPALTQAWHLSESGQAWLTMSVQIGFVAGAFGSALLNVADRLPARKLFASAAMLAGLFTAMIPAFVHGLAPALVLRFMSGMMLAAVYPVGMKLMATWTKADRGLGIGLLVGALTLGKAAPHLLKIFGEVSNWKLVFYGSAALAVAGGLLGAVFVHEGPYRTPTPPFNWKYVGKIFRQREVLLANLGYLGHMWELYAMWTWVPLLLQASFKQQNLAADWASLAAFAAIGIGGLGSFIAGKLADHYGRTTITIASLLVSGACSLLIGFLFGGNPILLVFVCLIWGFTVVADSAQFSACVTELAEREYLGTALTLQTSLGFLLTTITIRLIPTLESWVGWSWAFAFLTIGPVLGIWAMITLRRSPEAAKLAGGKG